MNNGNGNNVNNGNGKFSLLGKVDPFTAIIIALLVGGGSAGINAIFPEFRADPFTGRDGAVLARRIDRVEVRLDKQQEKIDKLSDDITYLKTMLKHLEEDLAAINSSGSSRTTPTLAKEGG